MTGHSAEGHKETRKLQAENDDSYHHPAEKISQLQRLSIPSGAEILEVFAGQGNLTAFYNTVGNVEAMKRETHGNSFDAIYQLRADKRKFDLIDIDSYGYPDKLFPVVFEMLKDKALLVFTFPVVGVNCVNGIVDQHFVTFWRSLRPTPGDITGIITDFALREWYLASLIDLVKIKRIWRFAFELNRVKATEMTFTRNR